MLTTAAFSSMLLQLRPMQSIQQQTSKAAAAVRAKTARIQHGAPLFPVAARAEGHGMVFLCHLMTVSSPHIMHSGGSCSSSSGSSCRSKQQHRQLIQCSSSSSSSSRCRSRRHQPLRMRIALRPNECDVTSSSIQNVTKTMNSNPQTTFLTLCRLLSSRRSRPSSIPALDCHSTPLSSLQHHVEIRILIS